MILRKAAGWLWGVALVLASYPGAWATPVGGGGGNPRLVTEHDFDFGTGEWSVGSPNARIDITADPTAPPWEKHLMGLVEASEFSQSYRVREFLHIGQPDNPGPHWGDWHEEIRTPGWDWLIRDAMVVANGTEVAGPNVPGSVSLSPDGTIIWFKFDRLPPSTPVDISKLIHCNNREGCADVEIVIREFPTIPAPASLALVALGLAGLPVLRKVGRKFKSKP